MSIETDDNDDVLLLVGGMQVHDEILFMVVDENDDITVIEV